MGAGVEGAGVEGAGTSSTGEAESPWGVKAGTGELGGHGKCSSWAEELMSDFISM